MIRIYKENRYSIKIEFDEQGAKKLIDGLKQSLNNEVGLIEATDMISGKKINIAFINNDDLNNIQFSKNNLIIELDSDEIEYAIERFTKSIIQKDFFPAELCEGTLDKHNVTLYARYFE